MPTYVAQLTLDSLQLKRNSQRQAAWERLKNALIQLGWTHTETSAFTINSSSTARVFGAMDLVARSESAIGGFSHVGFNVIAWDGTQKLPKSAKHHTKAIEKIRKLDFPT